MILCSIRDVKVGSFMSPFPQRNEKEAIVAFSRAVQNGELPKGIPLSDLQFFCLGEYNEETGIISAFPQPKYLCCPSDFGGENDDNK